LTKFGFIIGAQRSGSTLLYDLLSQHPSVLMAEPKRPEPKIFLKNIPLVQDYIDRFYPNHKEENFLIEKSTSYYESITARDNIYEFDKNAKIIIILRDPVFRAISNYQFSRNHKVESRSMSDVFIHKIPHDEIPSSISVNPFDYLERGNYYKHIQAYVDKFGKDNVFVLQFEKLLQIRSLKGLFEYLKLPDF